MRQDPEAPCLKLSQYDCLVEEIILYWFTRCCPGVSGCLVDELRQGTDRLFQVEPGQNGSKIHGKWEHLSPLRGAHILLCQAAQGRCKALLEIASSGLLA